MSFHDELCCVYDGKICVYVDNDSLSEFAEVLAEQVYERCGVNRDIDERAFDDYRYDFVEPEITSALKKAVKKAVASVVEQSAGWTVDRPLFERNQLDALLGDYAGEYDVDGIIEDVTEVDPKDGKRYWLSVDIDEVLERYERKGE